MKELIDFFEEAFKGSQSEIQSEKRKLLSAVRSGDVDTIERNLATFTSKATGLLTTTGYNLMLSEQFEALSFKQKMGITRFKLSGAASVGYEAVSEVERAILLERNKMAGIIRAPQKLIVATARINSSVGYVAKLLSGKEGAGSTAEAARGYRASQSSIIKHAQVETAILSSQKPGGLLEGMRITSGKEDCSYCESLSGYWTAEINRLRHFHSDCDCRLITKVS